MGMRASALLQEMYSGFFSFGEKRINKLKNRMVYAVFTSDSIFRADRFHFAVHISQMQLLFIGEASFLPLEFFFLFLCVVHL